MQTDMPAYDAFVSELYQLRDTIRKMAYKEIHTRELDITVEMLEVLGILFAKDGSNQQFIADALRKHKASITPLIDNLVQRGLVERRVNPSDRRNNLIFLTESASIYSNLLKEIVQAIYLKMQSGVEPGEIEQATTILQKLNLQFEP